MVLGPVNFPSEVHYTTVFALRNGKFSGLGGDSPPIPPLSYVLGYTVSSYTDAHRKKLVSVSNVLWGESHARIFRSKKRVSTRL